MHVGPAAEHVFENCLCVRQRADDNRNVCLLRNFERAVAEGLQEPGFARSALGEDGDGGFVLLDKLDCFQNCFERLAVVVAVKRQAENLSHDLRDDVEREIFRLRDERQLCPRHRIVENDRVKGKKMVGNQQEPSLARHLIQPRHMHPHAAEIKGEPAELVEQKPEIWTRLFHQLFGIDKQARDHQHQQKQQHQTQKAANKQQRQLPQNRPAGKPVACRTDGGRKNSAQCEQNINHERKTSIGNRFTPPFSILQLGAKRQP